MKFIDNIRDRIALAKGFYRTPYGKFKLARGGGKKAQRIVAQLMRTTDALTQHDMQDWRRAWQLAINVDYPNRQRLYDIYTDTDIDLHLSGCVTQRKNFVLAKSFKIVDDKGKEDADAAHFFNQEWFRSLERYALDSIYWGHSLIELGDVTMDGDGCPCYGGVTLIPRKYVIPERGRIITDLGQDWTTGFDYHERPFTDWLIEAGKPDDLGLYLKAASQTIPKKNMLSFWNTFGEVFGMPLRIAHTTTRDEKELKDMEQMMADMGTDFWGIFPDGTDIEVVESSKGDAFNVYDKRIDRANSELSKLIIGQTMTIEDGSSLSQSQTHLEVFENIVEADAKMLADIVNNQLLPRMVRHGFPLQGRHFEWDESIDYTPEQQLAFETAIADRYEVDPKYFAEKYNMPVGERRNNFAPTDTNDDPDGDNPNDPNLPSDPNAPKKDPKKKDDTKPSKNSFFD